MTPAPRAAALPRLEKPRLMGSALCILCRAGAARETSLVANIVCDIVHTDKLTLLLLLLWVGGVCRVPAGGNAVPGADRHLQRSCCGVGGGARPRENGAVARQRGGLLRGDGGVPAVRPRLRAGASALKRGHFDWNLPALLGGSCHLVENEEEMGPGSCYTELDRTSAVRFATLRHSLGHSYALRWRSFVCLVLMLLYLCVGSGAAGGGLRLHRAVLQHHCFVESAPA
jgi:hypothetical protein